MIGQQKFKIGKGIKRQGKLEVSAFSCQVNGSIAMVVGL